MLISKLTRFDSFNNFFFPQNSSCFYNVGRQEKSSDCLDTVLYIELKQRALLFING